MAELVSISQAANEGLDRAYAKAAKPLLTQIRSVTNEPRSMMQRALKSLDEEAERLVDAEKRMRPENAELEKALRENEAVLIVSQALIISAGLAIQEAGQAIAGPAVTAKVFKNITLDLLRNNVDPFSKQGVGAYKELITRAGIPWQYPDALDFATNYVETGAWATKMSRWGAGYANLTKKTMLEGVQSGWGPIFTAKKLRSLAENVPVHAAENLTRTLQLTSYRDASAAMELINGRYIEGKIRISALKQTSCVACVSLHGTKLRPGERVDDHYRGFCSEFYVVAGGPKQPELMQADSVPGKRRFVKYQTGEDWFNSLPPDRQARQASFLKSPAKLRAFRAGVPLSEFAGEHTDEVFGRQVIEKSLIKALGSDANEFYTVNQ